jgi:hypothetical protein
MPYIREEERKLYRQTLADLVSKLRSRNTESGDVVYCIYWLLKQLYGEGNFDVRSDALKVLEAAKLEYYRRIMAPYEDGKINENGDV